MAAPAPARRSASSLYTWGAVALVVIVIAVFVVIKVTKPAAAPVADTVASAQMLAEITAPNMTVANTVGTTSPSAPVSALTYVPGQPPLRLNGKPDVLYVGAEFCPYCAAERWALAVALGRFGTFSNLGLTYSADSPEVYPRTATLTFLHTTYTSPYLTFESVETQDRVHKTLQVMTARQNLVFSKYDVNQYLPANQPGYGGSIPFLDINNQYFQAGANYSPGILNGMTHQGVASGLGSAGSPVTAAIVATANIITADICVATHQLPHAICTAPGVKAGAKAQSLLNAQG